MFLLGSFHLLSEKQYPLPAVFDSVYAQSNALFFETNVDSATSPALALSLLQRGVLPQNQTLNEVLADSVFQKVKRVLTQFGQPVELYIKMQPWLLSLMLNQLNMNHMGFKANLGLEVYFSQKAKQDRKATYALETLGQQIRLLEQLSTVNPNKLLLETIKEIENANQSFQDLLNAWQNGNARALDSLINVGLKEFPEIEAFLLIQRNENWLQKIEPLLTKEQNYLIIVGAGHLVGPKGLVEMLRKKGYTVKQL